MKPKLDRQPKDALERAREADLDAARRVLRVEAEALEVLAKKLDGALSQTLDILAAVSGRVVVTGMGKSGHVARKMAATFASTGTPALYVHPGEASHGDLGMIARGDAVVALSNSGSTAELSDILAYTRRYRIPLVAITSKPHSTLAEQADVLLLLPQAAEACPMGLAPTTSTTMMLVLGDAMAVALFERKGFSSDDFHMLHPGGSLGSRLLRVADIMHGPDELPLTRAEVPMSEAILVMTAKRFGCVGVTDAEGRLIGIITDGDLRRHMDAALLEQTAGQVMTADPKTIRPQALAAEAVGRMNAHMITNLFVVEDERIIGFIEIHDCLRAGVA